MELQSVAEHLVIVGGGVIGCELAFIHRAFGARVTVVEGQGRVLPLPSVDGEISRLLLREMKKKGIAVELSRTVSHAVPTAAGVPSAFPPFWKTRRGSARRGGVRRLRHGGRVPNAAGFAQAGVRCDPRGWVIVDDTLETSVPGVYAVGDILGPRRVMLAHMAAAEAGGAQHPAS